jgi:hypothetical protein
VFSALQVTAQPAVKAAGYERRVIYAAHPQSCGGGSKQCRSSEWTGTWLMPDGSLMVAFNQATGPTSPESGRTFTPEELLERFKLRDGRRFTHRYPAPAGFYYWDKGYDYYGLSGECPPSPQLPTTQKCSLVVYLRSVDFGRTWTPWRTDSFRAIGLSAYSPQPTIALPNGTLIRRVNGDDLRDLDSIPHTAMLQTIKPVKGIYPARWTALDKDQGVIDKDPQICKYQISRIRRLRDGRFMAIGQAWRFASGGTRGECATNEGGTIALWVARSAKAAETGRWRRAMPDVPASVLAPNEWDAAELPNGDLLALFRTQDSPNGRTQMRRQAILRARTDRSACTDKNSAGCWVMDRETLGNPGNFPHSGHPELLAAREGVILQFATTGISYTADEGKTWIDLEGAAATNYYPRAIQHPATGDIFVFSHVGGDDPYGGKSPENGGAYAGINQLIVMQKFKLSK